MPGDSVLENLEIDLEIDIRGSLKPYTNFYESTSGRRIFGLRQSLEVARKFGDEDIVEIIERAIKINLAARKKEVKWRKARQLGERSRTKANEIDVELDRAVGALHTQLQNIRSVYHDQPRGESAAELLSDLFPEGAGKITTMAFEDELSNVQYIVEHLRALGDDQLTDLGIEPLVDQLDRLADRFADALANYEERPVGWDEVRAANEHGQEAMLQAVVKVLGTYPTQKKEDVEARSQILEPIIEQDERIAELHRNERAIKDVDPESGEENVPPGEGSGPGSGAPNDGGQPTDGENDGGQPTDSENDGGQPTDNEGEPDGDSSSGTNDSEGESDQPNG
jgi:hypothetical protein